jgi:AcrR family transcriptional regulator
VTTQSLRQKHVDRTRQAIVDAAFKLFLERGFAATTIDDIALEADIAPRTFFRYFPTKESVMFHDSEAKIEVIHERVMRRPAGESAAEAIFAVCQAMAEDVTEDQKRAHLILHLSVEDDTFLVSRRRAMTEQVSKAVLTAISTRTGIPESDIGLQAMTASVVACAATALHAWFHEGGTGDVREYLDRAATACRDAFNTMPSLR